MIFEGINEVMHGMSRRTKHHSKMEESVHDLKTHYEEFFPELEEHVKQYLMNETSLIIFMENILQTYFFYVAYFFMLRSNSKC